MLQELVRKNDRQLNPELILSVDSVREGLKKGDLVLVDVRDAKLFSEFRIPGSINVPLYTVKTKTFLRSKPVVLMNEGYAYSQLEKECASLRGSGFAVSILQGGLHKWKEEGGAIEGNLFLAEKELIEIPPSDFFPERDYEHWLVIDISKNYEPEIRQVLPQSVHISIPEKPDDIKKSTVKQVKKPFLNVLFVDDNGDYKKLEKLVKRAGIENAFYLKGGFKAYRDFLDRQVLIRQAKDKNRTKTMTTRKPCPTCPDGQMPEVHDKQNKNE